MDPQPRVNATTAIAGNDVLDSSPEFSSRSRGGPMNGPADEPAIRERVKRIIFNVTRIPVERIADAAAFREDLELDSLSLLEIGVDLDYEFQLGLEDLEQRLGDLPTVDRVVAFVHQRLQERATA
jgi:acyl carrier protein